MSLAGESGGGRWGSGGGAWGGGGAESGGGGVKRGVPLGCAIEGVKGGGAQQGPGVQVFFCVAKERSSRRRTGRRGGDA